MFYVGKFGLILKTWGVQLYKITLEKFPLRKEQQFFVLVNSFYIQSLQKWLPID